MKYLAFDLEIVKEIQEGGDWKEQRPLGISCAATIRSGDLSSLLWYPGQSIGVPKSGAMSKVELLKLVDYMTEQLSYGYFPLTWNGLQFDFDVLAEESGDYLTCSKLAMLHVDMMFHFFCIKGFPLGLKAASKGMKLEGKTEGMTGALAPPLWANNNERLIELGRPDLAELSEKEKLDYVLKYVGQDAIATLELAEAIDKAKGKLRWISKKGHPNEVQFENGFLPVKKALELPEPNNSWMTDPIKREAFYSWMS